MASPVSNGATLKITDYRDLLRELRKIEPSLVREMKANIRQDAAPLRQSVRNNIPGSAPLSHMVTPVGRLSWGRGKPAKSAVFDTRVPKKATNGKSSLIKIVVGSPATVLADMAGKTGKYVGTRKFATGAKANSMPITRGKYKGEMGYAYTYRDGNVSGRKHRNTGGQGRGLITGLSGRAGKGASRYVWPAAEKGLPATRRLVKVRLEQYFNIINDSMRTR
jgi:hypothetical protein